MGGKSVLSIVCAKHYKCTYNLLCYWCSLQASGHVARSYTPGRYPTQGCGVEVETVVGVGWS